MGDDPSKELGKLRKRFIVLALLEVPGMVMLALWGFGTYGPQGDALLPILGDQKVLNMLFAFGAAIVIMCGSQFIRISKRMKKLRSDGYQ